MKYLSGVYALNVPNELETCGDWHSCSLDWSTADRRILESNESPFGDWGIEGPKKISYLEGLWYVADDLRAILDIMFVWKDTRYLKGFRNDFLCTDQYNRIFFEKVWSMRGVDNWSEISKLMEKEFTWDWISFQKEITTFPSFCCGSLRPESI